MRNTELSFNENISSLKKGLLKCVLGVRFPQRSSEGAHRFRLVLAPSVKDDFPALRRIFVADQPSLLDVTHGKPRLFTGCCPCLIKSTDRLSVVRKDLGLRKHGTFRSHSIENRFQLLNHRKRATFSVFGLAGVQRNSRPRLVSRASGRDFLMPPTGHVSESRRRSVRPWNWSIEFAAAVKRDRLWRADGQLAERNTSHRTAGPSITELVDRLCRAMDGEVEMSGDEGIAVRL